MGVVALEARLLTHLSVGALGRPRDGLVTEGAEGVTRAAEEVPFVTRVVRQVAHEAVARGGRPVEPGLPGGGVGGRVTVVALGAERAAGQQLVGLLAVLAGRKWWTSPRRSMNRFRPPWGR